MQPVDAGLELRPPLLGADQHGGGATAKSRLENSLKEAGAKLRAGLEDLKKVDAADPRQIIIAYNVECLRR